MPHTTLLTNTALACLVWGLGCGNQAPAHVDEPVPVTERSTTIRIPGRPPSKPIDTRPIRFEAPPAAPLMSTPPAQKVREAPNAAPKRAKPAAPTFEYRDRCGRPLIA
jgi:hypothetical protein